MSNLEKLLIFLFVLMTGVCVGLVAIYFTDEANAPTNVQGECETCSLSAWLMAHSSLPDDPKGPNITVISSHDRNIVLLIWSPRCNLHP